MKMDDRFLKFHENIKLTAAQREDAIAKHTGVCKKLHDYYYPTIKYTGNTKLLIGSYGKKTNIRPARDVDVIFIMPPEKFVQYDDNNSNCQSQLLQDVKRILMEKYPNTPIKTFGKVIVLEFADTKHNVELLPAWENADGTFNIPNSENCGSWEHWNPRLEIKKIKDCYLKYDKTKFLIRVIKKWSENCTANIKSFKIENNVLEFFAISGDSDKEYPILVRDFFEYFYNATNDENLKSHIATALNRAKKACDFEENDKTDDAIVEWRKIFGDDFPVTIEKEFLDVIDENIKKLYLSFPSDKEEYLGEKYGIATNLNSEYRLKIDADVAQDGFRNNPLSYFIHKKFPLLKNKRLVFKIIKNTIPPPFEIKWKVRNFGDEAKMAGGLRGEISDDIGRAEKKESTRYMGEHYVECYIIKNGVCIAQDKILVPIGNN